jgi:hypothetical protein
MAKLPHVSEADARGPAAELFEAVRSALRSHSVGAMIRTWASAPAFLELVWRALEPNVRTRFFEMGADRVRERAVDLADDLARPEDHLPLIRASGLSDRDVGRIRDTLAVFHYLDPKLLIVAEAVRLAWRGEAGARGAAPPPAPAPSRVGPAALHPPEEEIARGAPEIMVRVAPVAWTPDALSEQVRTILEEAAAVLRLPEPPEELLAFGRYVDYLEIAWRELKPVVQKESFGAAIAELRATAADVIRGFPRPFSLDRAELIRAAGGESGPIAESIEAYGRSVPALTLCTALLARSLYGGEIARRSPFPIDAGRARRRAPAPPPAPRPGERFGQGA